jgi:hypothetical protein
MSLKLGRSLVAGLVLLSAPSAAAAGDVTMQQLSLSHRQVIEQSGTGNLARIDASGVGHRANVVQSGAYNTALMSADGARANQTIAQYGHDNFAVQSSRGADNVAVLTQGSAALPGARNVALQAQAGDGNYARITQNGSDNVAAQVQVAKVSLGRSLSMAADLSRDLRQSGPELARTLSNMSGGHGNRAELTQDGDDNLALMIQAGDGNSMDIHQSGGAANVYIQIGDNLSRSAYVHQSAGAEGVTPLTIIQSR